MQRHNLLYQYRQLYFMIRNRTLKQHLINLVCFSIFILYILYINKFVQYLLYIADSHDYPYYISWTSFNINEIIMNLGFLGLFYICFKICGYRELLNVCVSILNIKILNVIKRIYKKSNKK